MLQQASAADLLRDTISLVVTAHPDARELSTHDVIPKPLDLDSFLDQVRRVLASSNRTDNSSREPADGTPARRSRFIVELVLYVSSSSPASIQARRNLEQVLDGFDRSQIKYTICDLGRDPMAGEIDRVAFTPTLVKRYPEPRMWLLGSLRETDLIADLLRVCGVDAKA
jgi:circadian clock protein KaiB